MRRSLPAALAMATLLAVAASPAAAQQHQHGAKADTAKTKTMKHDMAGGAHDMKGHMPSPWKEMDAFHAVLGSTFHPAADKGDFAPLKAAAQTLADKATAWAASPAPAGCATDANKQAVTKVASSTADLAAKVRSGASDAELKAAITAIHDTFETVEHACPPGGMKGMKH